MPQDQLVVRGAREHNLKDVTVTIPRDRLVVITGLSGSGKSSVSRAVAQRLGLRYLDTGAMYRALTWWLMSQHADTADLQALAGTDYPASGQLSGQFVGGGTAAQPELSGQFQLDNFKTYSFAFLKINGRIEVDSGMVRFSGVTATFGSGTLGGQ